MPDYRVSVFISHSWAYSEHYDTLAEWLFRQSWTADANSLHFVDNSIPKDDPIHYAQNQHQLRTAIFQWISRSDVVVIPTGMYANYSKWIQEEIDGSRQYAKPILAVNPWGQERKSTMVAAAARETVGWTSKSVASGVWRLFSGN